MTPLSEALLASLGSFAAAHLQKGKVSNKAIL